MIKRTWKIKISRLNSYYIVGDYGCYIRVVNPKVLAKWIQIWHRTHTWKLLEWYRIRPGNFFQRYDDVPWFLDWAVDFRRKEIHPLWAIGNAMRRLWLAPAFFLYHRSIGYPSIIKDENGNTVENKTYWHGMRLKVDECGAIPSIAWWKAVEFKK